MRCARCHETNPPHARFCIGCGQRLAPCALRAAASCPTARASAPPAASRRRRPPRRRRRRRPPGTRPATSPRRSWSRAPRSRASASRSPCSSATSSARPRWPSASGPTRCTTSSTASSRRRWPRSTATRARSTSSSATGSWRSSARRIAHEDHARRAALAALGVARGGPRAPSRSAPARRDRRSSVRMGLNTGLVVVGAHRRQPADGLHGGRRHHEPGRAPPADGAARARSSPAQATARLDRRATSTPEPLGARRDPRARRAVPSIGSTGPGPRRSRLDAPARAEPLRRPRARDGRRSRDAARARERGPGRRPSASWASPGSASPGCSGVPARPRPAAVTWLEGRCLSYGRTIPYLPVLDVLRATCRIAETDAPEAVAEKLRAALAAVGLDPPARAVPAPASRLKEGTAAGWRRSAPRRSRRADLRDAAPALPARQPAPPARARRSRISTGSTATSEDVLPSLAEALAGGPILLLATYRPGYRPAWLEQSYATQIALRPCRATTASPWCASVLATPAAHAAGGAAPRAGRGQSLLPGGAGARRRPSAGGPRAPVPDTLHGVLTARIDRLPADAKRLLQVASVLGREFSRGCWRGPARPATSTSTWPS